MLLFPDPEGDLRPRLQSGIRYRGQLASIDPEQANISLENVYSMGTEGRRGNPAEELPPSSNLYE